METAFDKLLKDAIRQRIKTEKRNGNFLAMNKKTLVSIAGKVLKKDANKILFEELNFIPEKDVIEKVKLLFEVEPVRKGHSNEYHYFLSPRKNTF